MSRPTGCGIARSSASGWGPWVAPLGGPGPWVGFSGGRRPWFRLVSRWGPWFGLVGGWGPWFYCELRHSECLLWWLDAVGVINELISRNCHVEGCDVLPS